MDHSEKNGSRKRSAGTSLSGWVKSFPAERFGIDNLKSEPWACHADGVVVEVLDETDQVIARYFIGKEGWRRDFDNIAGLQTDGSTMRDKVFKEETPF
jgi:hypothetical protein